MQLTVIEKQGKFLIDSREVAEMTGKEHSNLMRDIRGYVEILENKADSILNPPNFFIESTYFDSQGKERACYLLTKKGCDMVANKMTGEKGILFTATYVSKFEEMEKKLSAPKLPVTYKEALLALVQAEEEKEKLLLQAEKDKPKIIFADAVASSKTTILIGELSKLLKQNGIDMGQNRLFQWLRENEYLIKRKGTDYNMPTQRSMELGLFEIKETSIAHADGHISISKTPKVTGKGSQYFINKFLVK
jgi:Rha family phage regulatory protein